MQYNLNAGPTPDFQDSQNITDILSEQLDFGGKRNDDQILYPTAEFNPDESNRQNESELTAGTSIRDEGIMPQCSFEVALDRVDECFSSGMNDAQPQFQFNKLKITPIYHEGY